MSSYKSTLGSLLLAAAIGSVATAQQSPNLGVVASAEEIAGWDVSVPPSGDGLPAGAGTAAQGAEIFAAKCAVCHGPKGEGLVNDRLVGGQGTIDSNRPVRTVGSYWPYATTIFDYVRRAMPYQQPHSLTNDETYALTAHLLYLNGIIGENDVMNADTLANVEMPNRDNFDRVYGASE